MCAVGLLAAVLGGACARSADPPAAPSAAPDELVFASERTDDAAIVVTTGDRSAEVTGRSAYDGNPSWSPDGLRIAFDTNRHDPNGRAFELYVASEAGRTRLTRNEFDDFDPDWSPDGRRIAFASIRNDNADIYVMPAVAGARARRLTKGATPDHDAAWSPDGRSIAFASRRGGNWDIFLMDAGGRSQRRVTRTAADEGAPAWSPDGERIAFWGDAAGNEDIYVADPDGADVRRLTTDPGSDVDPAWSPDGTRIAFAGERDGNFDVYAVGADGSGLERVTTGSAYDSSPDWRPPSPRPFASGVAPAAVEAGPSDSSAGNAGATREGGWPVAPVHRQHPVRGSFLEPRRGYHFGIDVNVRDDRPDPSAPAGRAHAVYAVEGGTVERIRDGGTCFSGRLTIGHFSYWHVDAIVTRGRRVAPGQMIGWTCKGWWHVHLSEWRRVGGRQIWVNPLRRRGALRPYVDSAQPRIRAVRFFTPSLPGWSSAPDRGTFVAPGGRPLAPGRLRGIVDVRAWIDDPQSFRGWMRNEHSFLHDVHHPYRVRVTLRRAGGRSVVFAREVVRADAMPRTSPRHYFAPGTRKLFASACIPNRFHLRPYSCRVDYWIRVFARPGGAFWDTRTVPDGRYDLVLAAWDAAGNGVRKRVRIAITND